VTRVLLLGNVLAIAAAVSLAAQQMPDRSFRPMIEDRAYATGAGPVVCFDAAHGNRDTLTEGFWPFADLVRRDGYVLRTTMRGADPLADCRLVVIASPRSRVTNVDAIRTLIGAGGGLLVIVDRDSLSAASELAAAFGVAFADQPTGPVTFRSTDQTLRRHAIARGRHAKESATSVASFGGLALQVPATAEPLLVSSDGAVQGAVMRVEMGRAAFFTDPLLFTAQIVGAERRVVGMSARGAEHNFRFVLNVMHWLSGVI